MNRSVQPQNSAMFFTWPVHLIFSKIKVRSVKPPEVYDVVVSLFFLLSAKILPKVVFQYWYLKK